MKYRSIQNQQKQDVVNNSWQRRKQIHKQATRGFLHKWISTSQEFDQKHSRSLSHTVVLKGRPPLGTSNRLSCFPLKRGQFGVICLCASPSKLHLHSTEWKTQFDVCSYICFYVYPLDQFNQCLSFAQSLFLSSFFEKDTPKLVEVERGDAS